MSHHQPASYRSDCYYLSAPPPPQEESVHRPLNLNASFRGRGLAGRGGSRANASPRDLVYPLDMLIFEQELDQFMSTLTQHGCDDLTHFLRQASEFPVSGGGAGDVYTALLGPNHSKVAVKTTRLYIINNENPKKYLKRAAKEVHTWSKCQHPNVHRLLGVARFQSQLAMVSEWMPQGNVTNYLGTKQDVDRCRLCHGIAKGLAYLHRQRIIHGDLKGGNVLISGDGEPLLTDFGNAVLHEQSIPFTETTTKGFMSLRWTAPEILAGDSACSYPADVYALGMTWLEVITGKLPHHDLNDQAIPLAVVNSRRTPARPEIEIPVNSRDGDLLWNLLVQCWAFEPEQRPSASQAQEMFKPIEQAGLADLTGEVDVIPKPLISNHQSKSSSLLDSNIISRAQTPAPMWELWKIRRGQSPQEALHEWQAKAKAVVEWEPSHIRDSSGVITCMVTPIRE